MSEPTNTPGTGAPGTSEAAPGTDGQQVNWQEKAQEWQKRFTGLQGRFQAEQNAHAELQARFQELNDKHTNALGERDDLSTRFTKLSEDHDSFKTEAELARAQYERMKMIAADYPDLMPLELQGLLPDAAGDDLKTKLAAFRSILQDQKTKAQSAMASGATPPSAPPASPGAANELMKQAIDALRSGNMAEYDRLSAEYYASLAKKQGA